MTAEMRWMVAGLWIALLASCNQEASMASGGGGGSGSTAPASSAGGGFSADLARELAGTTGGSAAGEAKPAGGGSGDAAPAGKPAGAGSGDIASAGKPAGGGSGDVAAGAGSGDVATAGKPAGGGSGDVASAGKPAGGDVAAAGKPAGGGSGDASAGKPAGADADPKPAGGDPNPAVATGPGPVIQPSGAAPKKVTVPAELAAIKFGMLPNWERDVQDAGTLSLAVKIPGRTESAVFVFRYGYEDASAPAERDAYKKWLADKRLLTARQDRQAGAAWILEGVDGKGSPAFRVVVNWGGRKLICYGSLYRDAESSRLGDLRDQTILQAKQICESIAL